MRAIVGLTLAIIAAGLFLPGCGDSDQTLPPPSSSLEERLLGAYALHGDADGGYRTWLRLGRNGSCVNLYEHSSGVRRGWAGEWSAEIGLSVRVRLLDAWYVASLADHDSTLTLVSEHENDTYVYRRASDFPDPNRWVREIRVLEEFTPPTGDPTDLAWDGKGIWFPDGAFARLRRMDPAHNLEFDRSVSPPFGVGSAIAHAGRSLWYGTFFGGIHQVSDSTGDLLASPDYEAHLRIRGLAVAADGSVWVSCGRLDRVDPVTGAVADSIELHSFSQSCDGLEFAGDDLYLALSTFGICRVAGPPWRLDETWVLPEFSIRGMAFDGTDWWLFVIDSTGNVTTRIVRAELLDSYLQVVPDTPHR